MNLHTNEYIYYFEGIDEKQWKKIESRHYDILRKMLFTHDSGIHTLHKKLESHISQLEKYKHTKTQNLWREKATTITFQSHEGIVVFDYLPALIGYKNNYEKHYKQLLVFHQRLCNQPNDPNELYDLHKNYTRTRQKVLSAWGEMMRYKHHFH
jgi:hypothetical protein